ncbi:MAG: MFS transporter [Firmicutes bacterium]|nr:MFS transporter [Bacillota bacterium]
MSNQGAGPAAKLELPGQPICSIKAGYFLALMAMFAFGAYVNVYLHRVGLSGKEIGLVSACGPLTALISQPFWGNMADYRLGRTRTLRLLLLMCAIICPFYLVSDKVIILMVVAAGIAFFSNSVVPMMDAITMGLVGSSEGGFADIRLWGTVGGIAATLIAGFLFERLYVGYVFYMYAILMYICWFATRSLQDIPMEIECPVSPTNMDHNSGPRQGGLVRLLSNKNFALLTLSAFLLQLTNTCHQSFFGVYLIERGYSESVVGMAWLLALVSELAFWLLYRFLVGFSARALYLMGTGCFALRWLLNALIKAPQIVVLTQILTGFSLSITYLAGVSLVDRFSPVDLRATGQTIFTGLTMGGGAVAGSLIGGALYDAVGLKKIYLGTTLLALLAIPPLLRLHTKERHDFVQPAL